MTTVLGGPCDCCQPAGDSSGGGSGSGAGGSGGGGPATVVCGGHTIPAVLRFTFVDQGGSGSAKGPCIWNGMTFLVATAGGCVWNANYEGFQEPACFEKSGWAAGYSPLGGSEGTNFTLSPGPQFDPTGDCTLASIPASNFSGPPQSWSPYYAEYPLFPQPNPYNCNLKLVITEP